MESENPDQETFSPQDNMYQDLDIQKIGDWSRNRDSPTIDLELEEMNEKNVEENRSDEAYYEEPHYNTRDRNGDSEKEDDTDTLSSVSSLLEKAQLFRSAVKTASSLSLSQNNGVDHKKFSRFSVDKLAKSATISSSKTRKRKATLPIDIDSDSDIECLKNSKRRSERMNLVEAIVESKRMDTEFRWAEHNYHRKHDERVDRKEAMRYEEVMKEAETCRLQLEFQLETMRQRTMRMDRALDKLEKM